MNVLKALWGVLDGHKTDLIVLAGVILWFGWTQDWWTFEQIQELPYLLGLLGVATFRDALRKA